MTPTYYIGIDPGKHTGIAVWNTAGHFIGVYTMPIHDALVTVYRMKVNANGGDIRVFFEDARKRTYLPRERFLAEFKGKAMGAGSVKRDSTIWQDALTDWGIPFEMVPPRAGMTKWDADTFARITGWKGRTSNHARDAALLVFGRK